MKRRYQSGAFWAILLAALLLGACSWAPTSKTVGDSLPGSAGSQVSQSGFRASLEVLPQMSSSDSTPLRFTLVNESDAKLYLLRWYTPLEGIAGEIFSVKRDGERLPYQGILASRMPPTPDDYVALDAGASVSVVVDLAEGYDLSKPGEYSVKFLSPRISHVARSEAEMASTMEELGPVQIPCREITFKLSGAQAAAPTRIELIGYIRGLWEQHGQRAMAFDQIEWLTGEEAANAMREDGLCGGSDADCQPPNGFYARDLEDKLVAYSLTESVSITMQTLSHEPDGSFKADEAIDLARFRQLPCQDATAHLHAVPYWITLVDGDVTSIKEQYVP
jgi:hypothetical protein